MAELVDAQDSGSCGVTPVGVRLPSFAPTNYLRSIEPQFSLTFLLLFFMLVMSVVTVGALLKVKFTGAMDYF